MPAFGEPADQPVRRRRRMGQSDPESRGAVPTGQVFQRPDQCSRYCGRVRQVERDQRIRAAEAALPQLPLHAIGAQPLDRPEPVLDREHAGERVSPGLEEPAPVGQVRSSSAWAGEREGPLGGAPVQALRDILTWNDPSPLAVIVPGESTGRPDMDQSR